MWVRVLHALYSKREGDFLTLSNKELMDKFLERDLHIYQNLSAVMDIAIAMKEDENHPEDLTQAVDSTKLVKKISATDVRTDSRFMDLYWKSLHFLAPYDFDSVQGF